MDKTNVILIVDDNRSNLKQAQIILGKRYRVALAKDGLQALSFLENNLPDLILLDIMMPGIDGFETLKRIRKLKTCADLPVIFLTANDDPVTESNCLAAGAEDFIGKPFIPQVLLQRVSRILENTMYRRHLEQMVAEKVQEITRIQDNVIIGIANLIEGRSNETGTHVKNTKSYVSLLTEELQNRGLYPEILTQRYAADTVKASVLHDVGKIKVSDAILTKPGRLTQEEFEHIKQHAAWGAEIVENIIGTVENPDYVAVAMAIARHHHERWDGRGYPDGLAGEDIPLCARIMAVADVFDALAAERCYKKPIRPIERVFEMLKENSGTQFDPTLIQVFLDIAPKVIAVTTGESQSL